ncbi:MAG: DUF373 family protein [DPANN group archaeon]|nr:DUF373 family protein [DPANN group archaeon]
MARKGKVLVLSVDRDDDLGAKAGVKGPIIGEKNNIEAASRLLLADASESDGNAIFEAVRQFRSLPEAADVVTITGHKSRGFKSDQEIARQLDMVFEKFPDSEGVFLITDGEDDEQILPLIQARKKIVSRKILIVKQSRQLEKSYFVLKEALKDPTFARLVFGLPGIILLFIAIFQDLGLQFVFFAAGLYLLFRGLGFEEPVIRWIHDFKSTTSPERASFPLYVGAFLILVLSIWSGWEQLKAYTAESVLLQLAAFADGAALLFVAGSVLFLIGRIGDMHFSKEYAKIRRYALFLVSLLIVWFVIIQAIALVFGRIVLDEFLGYLVLAFIGSIISSSIIKRIYAEKYVVSRIKKDLEVYKRSGVYVGTVDSVNKASRTFVIREKNRKEPAKFSQVLTVEDYVIVK